MIGIFRKPPAICSLAAWVIGWDSKALSMPAKIVGIASRMPTAVKEAVIEEPVIAVVHEDK